MREKKLSNIFIATMLSAR